MLHIHCGDHAGQIMRESDVPGDVIVWTDILEQGPTPANLTKEEWWRVRAEFLCRWSAGGLTVEKVMEHHRKQDEAMEQFRAHEEAVLWFDACMYDQVILIRQLSWFSEQILGDTKLSLICVGEFPGFERFKGLGELTPEQMASLMDRRHDITPPETELAVEAWAAYQAPDPADLEALSQSDTFALPYLGEALVRHLEQFPSAMNGLDRLQGEILQAIYEGHAKPMAIFHAVSEMENRPYFGDSTVWQAINAMAEASHPPLVVDGPGALPVWEGKDYGRWTLSITDLGRDLLADRVDWIELNGIDRWLGGVYMEPHRFWRWNPAEASLTECH